MIDMNTPMTLNNKKVETKRSQKTLQKRRTDPYHTVGVWLPTGTLTEYFNTNLLVWFWHKILKYSLSRLPASIGKKTEHYNKNKTHRIYQTTGPLKKLLLINAHLPTLHVGHIFTEEDDNYK